MIENEKEDIEKRVEKYNKELDFSINETPLHIASKNGHLPIVEYLISKGANIEAKDYLDNTPLHCASCEQDYEIVEFLVSKGANKNAKNKYGMTPYYYAQNPEIRNILK